MSEYIVGRVVDGGLEHGWTRRVFTDAAAAEREAEEARETGELAHLDALREQRVYRLVPVILHRRADETNGHLRTGQAGYSAGTRVVVAWIFPPQCGVRLPDGRRHTMSSGYVQLDDDAVLGGEW